MSSFLYYQDFDILDDMQKQLYRQGMAAFGGIAPTYHIELLDRPTIVWDFHSLLLGVQMMFSFMLTDEKSSLKVCKHCGDAFVANRPNSVFCSGKCKNQYNVYKSRAKDKHICHYHVNDYAGGHKEWGKLRTLPIGQGHIKSFLKMWFDGQKYFGDTLPAYYEEKELPVFEQTNPTYYCPIYCFIL